VDHNVDALQLKHDDEVELSGQEKYQLEECYP